MGLGAITGLCLGLCVLLFVWRLGELLRVSLSFLKSSRLKRVGMHFIYEVVVWFVMIYGYSFALVYFLALG